MAKISPSRTHLSDPYAAPCNEYDLHANCNGKRTGKNHNHFQKKNKKSPRVTCPSSHHETGKREWTRASWTPGHVDTSPRTHVRVAAEYLFGEERFRSLNVTAWAVGRSSEGTTAPGGFGPSYRDLKKSPLDYVLKHRRNKRDRIPPNMGGHRGWRPHGLKKKKGNQRIKSVPPPAPPNVAD